MKKLNWNMIRIALVTLCVLGATHNAFALPDCADDFCSVEDNGGTAGADVAKDIYTLGEIPYVRLELPDTLSSFTITIFNSPVGFGDLGAETFSLDLAGDTTQKWFKLDTIDWNDSAVLGDWTVQASYLEGAGFVNKFSAFTVVTPEPISTTLFLLGGLPIAASVYRKRKKNAVKA